MNRFARFLILSILCFSARQSLAQAQKPATPIVKRDSLIRRLPPRPVVKKPKPLSKESSFGLRLTSNGWGVHYDMGRVLASDERFSDQFYGVRVFQIEFDEVNHPKQIKTVSQSALSSPDGKPTAYIFGKINKFYTLKLGYGVRKMIAGKPEIGNVSVHWFGIGGLSLGLLKPYYVYASVPNKGPIDISYSDTTKETFLDPYSIYGKSDFSKGLNETQIVPGLHLKTGLHFDFSKNPKRVLAVEAGVNFEVYTKSIPIMANQEARPYNVNLFASVQFGKRK